VLRAGAGLFPGRPVSGTADNRASALESPFCLCINTAYLLSDRAVCHLPFGGISLSSLANQAVVINLSTVQYPLCCLPVQIRPDIITVGMTPEMSCGGWGVRDASLGGNLTKHLFLKGTLLK